MNTENASANDFEYTERNHVNQMPKQGLYNEMNTLNLKAHHHHHT